MSKFETERNRSIPLSISARAYEVYAHLYGKDQSLQRLNERGGFGVGELFAFLYARSFPQSEWQMRTDEAFKREAK